MCKISAFGRAPDELAMHSHVAEGPGAEIVLHDFAEREALLADGMSRPTSSELSAQ